MLDLVYSTVVGVTWIALGSEFFLLTKGKAYGHAKLWAFPVHLRGLKMRHFMLLCFLLVMGCTSCSHTEKIIDTQSAVEANDLTAILSGCGQQLAGSGYLVCREIEAQNTASEFLVVHTPPDLNCAEATCTFVKLFFPDGRPTLEKAIPKGEALVKIPWAEIVNKPTFDIADRGIYSVSITTHFVGPDGAARTTYADGMIFLHVVRKEYISLIENEQDEAFYWLWTTEQNQRIRVTTGYRVFLDASATSIPIPHAGRFDLW